ncbi:MAG: hypothetical protein K2X27_24815 [Candidatus Obscuribacterales bacterium]|nr:hypothetical protein [Candidatus Obscuribacterales bacterium]
MQNPLLIAYTANIIILVPVLVSMFIDRGTMQIRAFQNQVQNSDGLRLLVASLWSAILLLSLAGLVQPERYIAVLILQVIYKFIYLVVYIVPRARENGLQSVPLGLSLSFAAIVIIWPILISLSNRS